MCVGAWECERRDPRPARPRRECVLQSFGSPVSSVLKPGKFGRAGAVGYPTRPGEGEPRIGGAGLGERRAGWRETRVEAPRRRRRRRGGRVRRGAEVAGAARVGPGPRGNTSRSGWTGGRRSWARDVEWPSGRRSVVRRGKNQAGRRRPAAALGLLASVPMPAPAGQGRPTGDSLPFNVPCSLARPRPRPECTARPRPALRVHYRARSTRPRPEALPDPTDPPRRGPPLGLSPVGRMPHP